MDKVYLLRDIRKKSRFFLVCVYVFVIVVFNAGLKETLKNFPCDFGYINFQDEPKVKFWDSAGRVYAFILSSKFKNFIIMRLDFAKNVRHFQVIFL